MGSDKWASKPSVGYADIEAEFEASLRRAFVGHRADYIILDDRRQCFLGESAAYGVEQGWLTEQFVELDSQSSELRFRLTDKGRVHFGMQPPTGAKEEPRDV